jgi:hypothetical protein
MADHNDALSPLVEELKAILLRAFEKGLFVGRVEGEANLRRDLEGLLNRKAEQERPQISEPVTKKVPTPQPLITGQRAPKGSVRPAILTVLADANSHGMKPDAILRSVHDLGHALIKFETIRTTLHKLAAEGSVRRIGENDWVLKTEGSNAGASEPSN